MFFSKRPSNPRRAVRLHVEALEDRLAPATYTVTNVNDSGTGSLRWAIGKANVNPGADTIAFHIAPGGPQTITPLSPLPDVTDRVTIDAATQPGYAGRPIIELNGSMAGGGGVPGLSVDGLRITADGCAVRGLVINRFTGDAIEIAQADANLVVGNYLGTDLTGRVDLGNGGNGVFIYGGHNNTIGATPVLARNLISGNTGAGVSILGGSTGATGNQVVGNWIGTDVTGNAALGNGEGVSLRAANNIIGGTVPGARNVISGNLGSGVSMVTNLSLPPFLDAATGNQILGNYIGTNAAGTAALGNATGVSLFGASGNTVGGTSAAARNVISGNLGSGVLVSADVLAANGNRVQGNYIGTNAAGTAAVGNGTGVSLFQLSTNNTVGGIVPGARNLISGNRTHGVYIGWDSPLVSGVPTGNLVQGNYVGTDMTGTVALPNSTGVFMNGGSNNTIGGSTPARNLISGNRGSGVVLVSAATATRVQSNFIGTRADGLTALGNGAHGVHIAALASGNSIGGLAVGTGNTIAFNAGDGVYVESGFRNAILSNSIHSNGGLGIDLGPNGVTPNDMLDADTGANDLQNAPELDSASLLLGLIKGRLQSRPFTTYTIQFFASPGADPTGFGEGKTYLGSVTVTTDANGDATFIFSTPLLAGDWISATATDPVNNTSEFSKSLPVS